AGGRPAIKELAPVVAQLQAEVDRCATLTATVTGSKDVVEGKLTELRGLTTPVELGPLESQFESLVVALPAKMPGQADVLARRLKTELDGAVPARREALKNWNAVKGQVDAVEKALDGLGTNSKCEPVTSEARTFKSLVLQKAISDLTAAHDWTKLLDNYTRAKEKSTELKARDARFTSPEIAEVRGKADKQVQSSITAVAAAIDALQ